MATDGLRPGKLPPDLLAKLLARLDRSDRRVIVGPQVGVDAAVIEFRPSNLIAKSDPVTLASDLIGWYAVQVNANDVAASGGTPRWFLATVLLPSGSAPALAEQIFDQIKDAADGLGITLIGGHTEVTIGIERPIVCGTMLGEVAPGGNVTSAGARPGDRILLTKGIAIEGTSVLARELSSRLGDAGVPRSTVQRAAALLQDPGISVVEDARTALSAGEVHAMHDPTEGGLATALAEIATASGCGVRIDASAVEVLPECEEVCRALDVNPWGLLASGALLIAVPPDSSPPILSALRSARITAREIGQVTDQPGRLELVIAGKASPLPVFARDEVARLLG
ncbi:MAG: hydrogenase expression protein [Chloroflexi bacterium]|nr:hydrogenase expression protein [Chloroflexota bacterium]